MRSTRTRRLALALAALFGLGFVGHALPANADLGDITTCIDVDENGVPQCDYPEDEPPEAPPEEPELPPADVDDTVVADPNFTG